MLTTFSFLLSTPGLEVSPSGTHWLSAMPGQFLFKGVVLLGAALQSLGEAWASSLRCLTVPKSETVAVTELNLRTKGCFDANMPTSYRTLPWATGSNRTVGPPSRGSRPANASDRSGRPRRYPGRSRGHPHNPHTPIALACPQIQSRHATNKRCACQRQPYPMLTSPRWAASATACVRPTALSFCKMACT